MRLSSGWVPIVDRRIEQQVWGFCAHSHRRVPEMFRLGTFMTLEDLREEINI